MCGLSSPSPQRHPTLSSGLKERLKRSRRSFTSPCSVAKRLCVDDEEEEDRQVAADRRETDNNPSPIAPGLDVNRNVAREGSEGISGCAPKTAEDGERGQLRKEVKEKTETLRRLKMVKMYRSKVSAFAFAPNLEHIMGVDFAWTDDKLSISSCFCFSE